MEPIQITQTLRPTRYAFVIAPDDEPSALLAVSINTALWGGVYNPIVLSQPEAELLGVLDEFDPDVIVQLAGEPVPVSVFTKYKERVLKREALTRVGDEGKPHLTLGYGILPVIQQIHDQDFRGRTDGSRVTRVSTLSGSAWDPYIRFVFGSYEDLPIDSAPYSDALVRLLQAKDLVFDPASDLNPLTDIASALDLTRHGLSTLGGSASFSSHIAYVGHPETLADLVEFWNLRATGRHVWFVPITAFESHEPLVRRLIEDGNYPYNSKVENHADLQRGGSVGEEAFERVKDWVVSLNTKAFSARTWRPRYGTKINRYVGDIHVASLEAGRSEEMSILHEGRMTPVRLIAPSFGSDHGLYSYGDSWSVDLNILGGSFLNDYAFRFPNGPKVNELVARRFLSGLDTVRVGNRGLSLLQGGSHGSLHALPVKTEDVFYALFAEAGLTAKPSKPGRYVDQIVRKMGSLQFDCRVFKIRGVRDVINQLSNGAVLTKGNMRDIVLSTAVDSFGKNWEPDLYNDMYFAGGKRGADFGVIFDLLLDRKVIRPGLRFECAHCASYEWYHVSEFTEEFACRYCFTSNRVPFASAREWQYKADGLFQVRNSALGSLGVILLLWRLAEVGRLSDHRYLSSVELEDSTSGKQYEVDCAVLKVATFSSSYDLVLGQATGFLDVTSDDVRKMREVADRFDKRVFLAFATLKDSYSAEEKKTLLSLDEDGYKLIALTRRELDPYDLFDRFKEATHPHAVGFSELSTNTIELNLRAGAVVS